MPLPGSKPGPCSEEPLRADWIVPRPPGAGGRGCDRARNLCHSKRGPVCPADERRGARAPGGKAALRPGWAGRTRRPRAGARARGSFWAPAASRAASRAGWGVESVRWTSLASRFTHAALTHCASVQGDRPVGLGRELGAVCVHGDHVTSCSPRGPELDPTTEHRLQTGASWRWRRSGWK